MPRRDLLTQAVVDLVEAGTGRPAGKGGLPSGPGVEVDAVGNPERTYSVVHPLPASVSEEGWSGDQQLIGFVYQVTAVADDLTGAEDFASTVHDVFLARVDGAFVHPLPATVDGLPVPTVTARRPDGPPNGVDRVGSLFQVTDRYLLIVSV